jgi:hypothetical protein
VDSQPLVATIVEGYRAVHAKLREAVRGLDEAALNWTPAPETNSIAVLVVHTIGSEQEVLRTVRGVAGERDRPAEFRTTAAGPDELIARLDEADRSLDELAGGITADDLVAVRPRGDLPPQSGIHWLVTNYGHAREHQAHIELTKQLYTTRQSQ